MHSVISLSAGICHICSYIRSFLTMLSNEKYLSYAAKNIGSLLQSQSTSEGNN